MTNDSNSIRKYLLLLLLNYLITIEVVVSFQTIIKTSRNNNIIFGNINKNNLMPRSKLYKSYSQKQQQQDQQQQEPSLLQKVVHQYVSYTSRLWNETSTEARNKISEDKISSSIKSLTHVLQSEEFMIDNNNTATLTLEHIETRHLLLDYCNRYLDVLEKEKNDDGGLHLSTTSVAAPLLSSEQSLQVAAVKPIKNVTKKKRKPRRSILFGATMGLIAAGWVFSGNYIFTALFTAMTLVGQLEYYRMVMNTGIYPARRISVFGACAMFVTALFYPHLHQIVLPVFATIAMTWFCFMRREISTIAEIATTFTGMFYLGYIPSFWVRIRLIGMGREPTKLAPIIEPIFKFLENKITMSRLPASYYNFVSNKIIHLPITTGAIFIFWSWLCIAFSDVGAYFSGRYFGNNKLNTVSPTAGKISPNKTIEGVIGGCLTSAILATIGGWVQTWPYWYILGPVHGVMLGLLGFIGDLTASMLKRDAGLKDFGDLIPEHGGIMDRVDSFIFTAPYSWVFCRYLIPFLKKVAVP